jgi:hypothetical protein
MELAKEMQIVEGVMKDLARWAEERRVKNDLFYCPTCTNVGYKGTYRRPPKCSECGTTMVKYDEESFGRRRRKLVEKAESVLPGLIDVLMKTTCAKRPPNWMIKNGRIEIELDHCPTKFTYDFVRNVAHIYFFYFDTPQHKEATERLVAELRRMGIRGDVVIYPPHANPPLPQDARFEGAAYVIRL